MKRLALTLIAAVIATPIAAKPASLPTLKKQWIALEQECRGGPHQPGDAVCRKRDAALRLIEARGVCWAYRDESVPPFEYDWHDCRRARP